MKLLALYPSPPFSPSPLRLSLSNLRFDDLFLAVALQPAPVDLAVEMANVAADGVVLHGQEMIRSDYVATTGGRHKDVGPCRRIIQGRHSVAYSAVGII